MTNERFSDTDPLSTQAHIVRLLVRDLAVNPNMGDQDGVTDDVLAQTTYEVRPGLNLTASVINCNPDLTSERIDILYSLIATDQVGEIIEDISVGEDNYGAVEADGEDFSDLPQSDLDAMFRSFIIRYHVEDIAAEVT